MREGSSADERLIGAIDELDAAIIDNIARSKEIQKRIRRVRKRVVSGTALGIIIEAEEQPRTVELITENIDTLHNIGSRLRAAQALALRDEGMTIAAIADLFGVTRQRVSALLRQKSAESSRTTTGG